MKNYLSIFMLIFGIFSVSAQEYYVVDDPDGFVNVRNNESKIIDRLSSGKAVWIFDEINEGYVDAEYSKGDVFLYGKIHGSRLRAISSFNEIPLAKQSDDIIILKDDFFKIEVSKKQYSKGERYYSRCDNEPLRINGSYVWGTDGNIPKEEYAAFKVSFDNTELSLPQAAYNDLFQPNLDNLKAYYNPENKYLYITSLNGDGAGGYVVLWLFKNRIFEERLILHGF